MYFLFQAFYRNHHFIILSAHFLHPPHHPLLEHIYLPHLRPRHSHTLFLISLFIKLRKFQNIFFRLTLDFPFLTSIFLVYHLKPASIHFIHKNLVHHFLSPFSWSWSPFPSTSRPYLSTSSSSSPPESSSLSFFYAFPST